MKKSKMSNITDLLLTQGKLASLEFLYIFSPSKGQTVSGKSVGLCQGKWGSVTFNQVSNVQNHCDIPLY